MQNMESDDILFITADHGCDPTYPGTDHTREYVPFLAYGEPLKKGYNLGTKVGFFNMGQTICDIFNSETIINGDSFLGEILK